MSQSQTDNQLDQADGRNHPEESQYVSQYETKPEFEIMGMFPSPVYYTKRPTDLNSTEEQEIKEILEGEMQQLRPGVSRASQNTYIFNTKLKDIHQFLIYQAKKYIKEIYNPAQELTPYVTQSWLNLSKPGDVHHRHSHSNSIISGVFYISTVEDDKINFFDPLDKMKSLWQIPPADNGANVWNAMTFTPAVENNVLLLFPSYFDHGVMNNPLQTKDRISLSFNMFLEGIGGMELALNQMKLDAAKEYDVHRPPTYASNDPNDIEKGHSRFTEMGGLMPGF